MLNNFDGGGKKIAPSAVASEETIALPLKPQEALEETEKMIGFLERCDGLAA